MTNYDKISFVEKRGADRITVPKGTTAYFENSKPYRNIVDVREISEVGMLICDKSPGKRYHIDPFISDIFVNIPNKDESGGFRAGSKVVCLFIDRG